MEQTTLSGLNALVGTWPPAPQRPTIVFIHGSGGSAVLWQHQVDALAGIANTIAVDLPGHGQSPGPGLNTVAAYTGRIADLVTALGPAKVVCCGLSLGGAIAQQLLLDHGHLFAGGILCGTGARLKVMPSIFDMIQNDYPAFVKSLDQVAISRQTDPARVLPLVQATAACPAAVTAGDFQACNAFDVIGRLDQINVPVLVVSGADDLLTPPKYADYLEKTIAGARRCHLEAAGHLAPMERPEPFNAAVAAFIQEQIA